MKKKLIASISATVVLALCAPAQEGPERSGDRGHPTSRAQGDRRPAKVHLRSFLRKHPEVSRALKKAADTDGDGKLSPEERARFLRMAREKASDWRQEHGEERRQKREEWLEGREEKREEWRAKRAEHMEDRAEKRRGHREERQEHRHEHRQDRREGRRERLEGRKRRHGDRVESRPHQGEGRRENRGERSQRRQQRRSRGG